MDIPRKHQMNIARKTLKMTPTTARIMGGMDYETAYKLVFNTDLKPRLLSLIETYGETPKWLSWELEAYGWKTPRELLDALEEG